MTPNKTIHGAYRGRFAPSPSGPLHFGSLVAALGSYLDAKSHHGTWLVRIEDIDTPRVVPGSDMLILKTLEHYGLNWDESVLYQSQCLTRYQEKLAELVEQDVIYACQCTRKQIKEAGGFYMGTCREKNLTFDNQALRINQQAPVRQFTDLIKGNVSIPADFSEEDYIVKRRDGLFAYQLVVVLDDIEQKITHIIRGADLLYPTARQISLFAQLNAPCPQFGHLPLAVAEPGFKLSKQNYATAINMDKPSKTLYAALQFLGITPPSDLIESKPSEILNWAITHWQRNQIARNNEIQLITEDTNYHFRPL